MISFNLLPERSFVSPNLGLGYRKRLLMVLNKVTYTVTTLCRYPEGSYNNQYDYRTGRELVQQLLMSEGKFVCYAGQFNDPFELLSHMNQNSYEFAKGSTKPEYICLEQEKGTYEIAGNLHQVSACFRYRFFNKETFDNWIEQAKKIDPYLAL